MTLLEPPEILVQHTFGTMSLSVVEDNVFYSNPQEFLFPYLDCASASTTLLGTLVLNECKS